MKMMKLFYPRPIESPEAPKKKKPIQKKETQEVVDSDEHRSSPDRGKEEPRQAKKEAKPKGLDLLAGFILLVGSSLIDFSNFR
jgi:hypothetical protein